MLSAQERIEAKGAFERWQRVGKYWDSDMYNGSEYDTLGGGVSRDMVGFGASSKSHKAAAPGPSTRPIDIQPMKDNTINHNHTPFRPHSSNRNDLTLSVSEKHLMVTYTKVCVYSTQDVAITIPHLNSNYPTFILLQPILLTPPHLDLPLI